MDDLEIDERFLKAEAFEEEFKQLVRRYVLSFPDNDFDMVMLHMLQERTSCFSPYVWSDDPPH